METSTLNCILHNTQDLFLFMDKYNDEVIPDLTEIKWQMLSTSLLPNKNLEKLLALSETYKEYDPDILLLVEVGGGESLENFNRHFLKNEYDVFYTPSNSDRGIDLGFLVKKKLAKNCKLNSFIHNKLINQKKFSRGVFELSLYKDNRPQFIFLLTHLKSKLNLKNTDFEGRGQRLAEVTELSKIYKMQKKKFPKTPIFICGDLNGIYNEESLEEEFRPFREIGLKDALDYKKAPFEDRVSYFYFDRGGNLRPMQLDYILGIEADLKSLNLQHTEIINFTALGSPYPYPSTRAHKEKIPSDHYPYLFQVKL